MFTLNRILQLLTTKLRILQVEFFVSSVVQEYLMSMEKISPDLI